MSFCVILADGDFPSSPQALEALQKAEKIICCDGAAQPCMEHGFLPYAIVGDLDSCPAALKEKYAHLLIQEKEQESNDLSKAFRYCMRMGFRNLVILGATGKREDHTLGNLALLADYTQKADSVKMITDYGEFTVLASPAELPSFPGEQLSFIALTPNVKVTLENVKYAVKDYPLSAWWQGTLNEALGENFSIAFPEGEKVLFYRAFQRKQPKNS